MREIKEMAIVAKVGGKHIASDGFIKLRNVNNLLKLKKYLDRQFPDWRYCNVFEKGTDNQIYNFTKKYPPKTAWVYIQ